MVDVKREDLTLQDWTKGISADEFAWGSYFFAEWIQSGYTTKWFKLWHRLDSSVLNYRSDGYAVAISPAWEYWMTIFTHDRRLETSETYNWSSEWWWDENWGWALYSSLANTTSKWVNWITYWTKAIAIRTGRIDVIDRDWLFNPASELLTQPKFENSASDWTLGTWWTLENDWVLHTAWNTWTLTTSVTTASGRVRIAIKIKGRTKWKITCNFNSLSEDANANWWFVMTATCSAQAYTLTITPSSTFDGTIEMVNVHQYDSSKINDAAASLTSADIHPAVIRGGELHIGSWNKVDIVNLSDRWVVTKELVDANETIIDITQQAWNLILWTTDGYNSRQYYWNWVDAVATECIEWKWLLIQWVTNTETVCYVLTTAWSTTGTVEWYQYRLYAVSGYQRNLLACKSYYPNSYDNIDKPQYNLQKKFDFNDVESSKSMCMFLDWLFIPGCDGVYKFWNEIPWMPNVWTRPIKYPFWSTHVILGQNWVFFCITYTLDWVNYFWQINEQRYTSTGYLVTEWIYRDKIGTRKNIEKMKIWFKNVASEDWSIKIYAIVDDDYFWRFTVSGVSTRPSIWDTYTVANQTTAEVISVDKTNNLITFRTTNNLGSYANIANTTLVKVSWSGDNNISASGHDNMCLIKTIENSQQWYGADLIFWKDFVNNYMPYRHKMQLVIELNSIDNKLTPEIYEISINSDITDVVL